MAENAGAPENTVKSAPADKTVAQRLTSIVIANLRSHVRAARTVIMDAVFNGRVSSSVLADSRRRVRRQCSPLLIPRFPRKARQSSGRMVRVEQLRAF